MTVFGQRCGRASGRGGRGIVVVAWIALLLVAVPIAAAAPLAKNVIYMIGDGMGFVQLEAARLAKGAPLVIDTLSVQGEAQNASLNNAVTDSAAAATAHATGSRTNNGMLAMTPDGQRLCSVLCLAQTAAMRTGVVTNDALHGATPGAYIANVMSRTEVERILEQAIFETQPDVMMGGGLTVHKQIGAAERLSGTGYSLVQSAEQLRSLDPGGEERLLGLFASGAMAYAVERPSSQPSIADMTEAALEVLSRGETGFFLMVENGRIDGAGHGNDLRRSVYDTLAFDEAVAVALDFAAGRDDTLVVVTADHETGGLTRDPGKPSVAVLLEGPAAIRSRITSALSKDPRADLLEVLAENIGEIGEAAVQPFVFQGSFTAFLDALLARVTGYHYTTTGHTDVPVPVFAQGPGAERFRAAGHIADMGQTVIELLGLNKEGEDQ